VRVDRLPHRRQPVHLALRGVERSPQPGVGVQGQVLGSPGDLGPRHVDRLAGRERLRTPGAVAGPDEGGNRPPLHLQVVHEVVDVYREPGKGAGLVTATLGVKLPVDHPQAEHRQRQ
jgi:hypothetical protein